MNVRKIILDHYRKQRTMAFSWGQNDCLLGFAAPIAEAITGRDPAANLRGRYNSWATLQQVMQEEGWKNSGDVAASMFPEIPISFVRSGDWAHFENDDGTDGIGVVVTDKIAAKTRDGMGQIPLSKAKRVFRVE